MTGACVVLIVIVPALCLAWECIGPGPLLTSDVSVQVFEAASSLPLSGVELELTKDGRRGKVLAVAKTDASGYVHFASVSPGRYRLHWKFNGFPSSARDLRVVASGQGPKQLLLVGLTGYCPGVCAIPNPGGAVKAPPPKCF